jgi:hypothetical protein
VGYDAAFGVIAPVLLGAGRVDEPCEVSVVVILAFRHMTERARRLDKSTAGVVLELDLVTERVLPPF